MSDYKPLATPGRFDGAGSLTNQIAYVLNKSGDATADELTVRLEKLAGYRLDKQAIANVRMLLSELHEKGLIDGHEYDGELKYHLKGADKPAEVH